MNAGSTSVIFKNYGSAARLQIVCRHEIGHGTRSAFKRTDFGTGDHSGSGLMTPYGASNTFSNADAAKDPDASQKITVQCKAEKHPETSFLLHPSVVDSTGEVTCIPVTKLHLKRNENRTVAFSLYPMVMDQCFSPGIYQVTVSYDSLRPEPCLFAISFRKESVPPLLQIVDDKSKDRWIRKEALQWLQRVKIDFKYEFNEFDNKDNNENLSSYKSWWDKNKNSEQIDALFERLKEWKD